MPKPVPHDQRKNIHRLFSELRATLNDAWLMEYDPYDALYNLLNAAEDLTSIRRPDDDRRNDGA